MVSEAKRTQRVLDDTEITGLVKAGLKIEKHYRMPMDIVWAIQNSELCLAIMR